jgi:hypothetical protein
VALRGVKQCFLFFSLTVGRGLAAFGPNENKKTKRDTANEHELGEAAITDTDLLLKVARYKEVFFPAAWAHYAEAKPGTLRLMPPDARLPELEQDYCNMREMIFGEPPSFEHLLDVMRGIERYVNE